MTSDLAQRSKYGANYIDNIEKFRKDVWNKTGIPYQVEIQPPSTRGKLCWLNCPYCYGKGTIDTKERATISMLLKTIHVLADNGVKKIIFAGYCTDPLNNDNIGNLLAAVIQRKMVFGFNTKGLNVNNKLLRCLHRNITPDSYISVSVDAGNNDSYKKVHGLSRGSHFSYQRVINNLHVLDSYRGNDNQFDITATYLLTETNNDPHEVEQFLSDTLKAGVDLVRFAFPQPRGKFSLTKEQCKEYKKRLMPLIQDSRFDRMQVIFAEADTLHNIFNKDRTLPCVARWVYPTIGFDGWVYPCSQTAAPQYRKIALGNLAEKPFWDIYYDYNPEFLIDAYSEMEISNCKCDRKEHLLNIKAGKEVFK